jgi:PDZ domain-containing secreted protein
MDRIGDLDPKDLTGPASMAGTGTIERVGLGWSNDIKMDPTS